MALAHVPLLFERVRLGRLTTRNRVFVPGHTTNFGRGNQPTERHVAYHAERARGGVGLIITEAVRVHPTSAGRTISLGSFRDDSIPGYAAVADAVHQEGALIFAQIMHAGRQASGDATRTAAWSASPIPWSTGAHIPHAMGRSDITTVVHAFGQAGRRMKEAGYDGVEVHAGHGHLLQQFLSPVTNERTDAYGGSFDNRLRLTREVLAAVEAAASDLPVGLRVSADEFLPGGLDPAAVMEIVAALRTDHPLVYVHVSHSAYHGSYSLATQMADMSFPHAPFRHHAAAFKKEFPDLPVLAVCRLDSLPEAAELVAASEADLVGLARPHIVDPHLVRKAREGRHDEARSCIACNQGCIGRVEMNLPISCVVNPEVGAEREWADAWATAAAVPPRRVLVVGGGPAGLEAALSARRGGHDVTLAEAGDRLGGQVPLAAHVQGRERIALLTEELERDVRKAGVTVRLGTRVTVAEVLEGRFDDVVVATGSRPSRRDIPGGPPVLDVRQVVESLASSSTMLSGLLKGAVVVLDDEGTWAAASLAEHLGRLGAAVHLVSPTASLAARVTTYSKLALVPRLAAAGVRAHLMRVVDGAAGSSVRLRDTMTGHVEELEGVTAIVDVGYPVADDQLYRELEAELATPQGGPRVYLIGDANAPRSALEAVYEGRITGGFLGRDDSEVARRTALVY